MTDDEQANEKPDACDSCEYPTADLVAFSMRPDRPEVSLWLCVVCRNTLAGNAAFYPEQYPDRSSMAMIAWGINHLAALVQGRATDV
jgi:hypothetical protein